MSYWPELLWLLQSPLVVKLCKLLCGITEGRGFDPGGVIGSFHSLNLSGRTMALGLAEPLTQKRTRDIYCGVKAAGT